MKLPVEYIGVNHPVLLEVWWIRSAAVKSEYFLELQHWMVFDDMGLESAKSID
jgi:hypothetical protein